jgi:hypothetical protein
VCVIDWDDYEINLDQRILDPEICMAACMAGRPDVRCLIDLIGTMQS